MYFRSDKMSIQLDAYISELLYDYDCVIVTQLGGFVTNYKPAHFNGDVAYPPSKELRFNKNLSKNDGLLAQTISSANNITIKEANSMVRETVTEYLVSLKKKKRIELKKIGVLYIDENEQLRFSPDTSVNYLRSSFGFESFQLPRPILQSTVSEKTTETELTEETGEEDLLVPVISSRSQNSIYWVAAATLLPFVAMSVYLGMRTDFKSPTELSVADLFPSSYTPTKYEARNKVSIEPELDGTETTFPENTAIFPFDFEFNRVDSLGVWVNLNDLSESTLSEEGRKNFGLYHIIGGCFSEKKNADRFVERLLMRGYNADILDVHNDLFRVKIESYNHYDEALEELHNTRKSGTFPSAWLLKKKVS